MIEDSPEAYAFAKNFVQACADTMGEHGLYINHPQTAADMNSILDAVGQEDMIYWEFSYGTLLGQTYAGLFPERSRRVIIDGVVNQFDWYNVLANEEDFSDTVHVFEGFFDQSLKAGENCTLSTFVESKDELMNKVLEFANSIYDEPLSVDVNNTAWGTLDYFKIGIAQPFLRCINRPTGTIWQIALPSCWKAKRRKVSWLMARATHGACTWMPTTSSR